MLNESKYNTMFINFQKKFTPIKFVFNFDNFPKQSIDNFLNLRVIFVYNIPHCEKNNDICIKLLVIIKFKMAVRCEQEKMQVIMSFYNPPRLT